MSSFGESLEERLYGQDVADLYGQLTPIVEWALFYLL